MSEDDGLRALFDGARERAKQAKGIYSALRSTGRLTRQRALTIRCPRRCLLLDVVPTPSGLLLHVPKYKLSPALNSSTSNAEGRAANTEDGDRHWRAQTFFEESALNVSLSCDHVRGVVDLADIRRAIAERTMEIIWTGPGCSS